MGGAISSRDKTEVYWWKNVWWYHLQNARTDEVRLTKCWLTVKAGQWINEGFLYLYLLHFCWPFKNFNSNVPQKGISEIFQTDKYEMQSWDMIFFFFNNLYAQHGARTQTRRSKSRTLGQLSQPGAPGFYFFKKQNVSHFFPSTVNMHKIIYLSYQLPRRAWWEVSWLIFNSQNKTFKKTNFSRGRKILY